MLFLGVYKLFTVAIFLHVAFVPSRYVRPHHVCLIDIHVPLSESTAQMLFIVVVVVVL
jgi:hypothetical protein